MRNWLAVAVAIGIVALRLWRHRRGSGRTASVPRLGTGRVPLLGDAGLVAAREIRERVRGRPFLIGTALLMAAVAAAILIPALSGGPPAPQRVGVVGELSAPLRASVIDVAKSLGTTVRFVDEPSTSAAHAALVGGHLDLAILNTRALVVHKAFATTDTSTSAQFVRAVAGDLGVQLAYEAAGLSPGQVAAVSRATPLPVLSLSPATSNPAQGTSIIGVILIFVMLSQYNGWILLGVMEEKASRVVEVLLATLRPVQLLGGKVLGIGLVAMAQASLIVATALVLSRLAGSDLLRGAAPLVVVSALVWLVLGYAFYCWVYAAAASMAERQEQVQSLAFPLSIPILVGYILALNVAGTGNTSSLFKVLAFLPPTAPFCMPVLVGLGQVSWVGFATAAVLSILATVLVARAAAAVYRRAILRTGGKVRLRDVVRAER